MMEETKEGETIRELMKLDLKKKLNERGRKKVTEIKGLKLNKEGMRWGNKYVREERKKGKKGRIKRRLAKEKKK